MSEFDVGYISFTEVQADGTEIEYLKALDHTITILPDGSKGVEYDFGQIETHSPEGRVQIIDAKSGEVLYDFMPEDRAEDSFM